MIFDATVSFFKFMYSTVGKLKFDKCKVILEKIDELETRIYEKVDIQLEKLKQMPEYSPSTPYKRNLPLEASANRNIHSPLKKNIKNIK